MNRTVIQPTGPKHTIQSTTIVVNPTISDKSHFKHPSFSDLQERHEFYFKDRFLNLYPGNIIELENRQFEIRKVKAKIIEGYIQKGEYEAFQVIGERIDPATRTQREISLSGGLCCC